jgi:hypothetical protein
VKRDSNDSTEMSYQSSNLPMARAGGPGSGTPQRGQKGGGTTKWRPRKTDVSPWKVLDSEWIRAIGN